MQSVSSNPLITTIQLSSAASLHLGTVSKRCIRKWFKVRLFLSAAIYATLNLGNFKIFTSDKELRCYRGPFLVDTRQRIIKDKKIKRKHE